MGFGFVRRNVVLWHILFAVVLLVTGFAAGRYYILMGDYSAVKDNNNNQRSVSINQRDLVEEPKEDERVKLSTDAEILFVTHYTKNSKSSVQRLDMQRNLAGMDKNTFAATYPDWVVESFGEKGAVLSRTVDSYSEGSYILTLKGEGEQEVLTVYGFDEAGERYSVKNLEVPPSNFDEATLKLLREGIYAPDRYELERLLQEYDE